jgi:hypothetical protein
VDFGKQLHDLLQGSQAPVQGLQVRQRAPRSTWPAVCGPRVDRIARSADSTRFQHVTAGCHPLLPMDRPGKLGQFARRHYWLAPRSDDAVGAGFGLGQGAAALQQLGFGCRRFGLDGPDRWRSWPPGPAVMPAGAGWAPVVPDG